MSKFHAYGDRPRAVEEAYHGPRSENVLRVVDMISVAIRMTLIQLETPVDSYQLYRVETLDTARR